MERTILNGLIAGLFAGLLAGCGGTSDSDSSSSSKLLATQAACYTPWSSTVAYSGGKTASYGMKNYTAAFWTQGQNPSTNNGPAGSGQPWLPGADCNSDPGVTPTPTPPPTPTPTPPPTCTPTPITPYIQLNAGTVRQSNSTTAFAGDTVKFSPQPSTGGSWSWTGTCSVSGASREQTITVSAVSCYAYPVYTNSCGAQSTITYTVAVADAPPPVPTPTPTAPPTPAPTPAPTSTCPQYVSGHAYATGAKVTNIGNYYQCTVGGWCSQGGAYDPGTGWAWTNAWNQIAASQCASATTPAPTPAPTPTPTPAPSQSACVASWIASKSYIAGNTVTYNAHNYQARFFTINQNPSTNSGPADQGYPWADLGLCYIPETTPAPTPTPTPTPAR